MIFLYLYSNCLIWLHSWKKLKKESNSTKRKKKKKRKKNKKKNKQRMFNLVPHCCEGKLKWKNHEITNAETIHVKRKLRNLFPLQNLRSSESIVATTVDEFPASTSLTVVSIVVVWSISLPALEKFKAIERQISQVLKHKLVKSNIGFYWVRSLVNWLLTCHPWSSWLVRES